MLQCVGIAQVATMSVWWLLAASACASTSELAHGQGRSLPPRAESKPASTPAAEARTTPDDPALEGVQPDAGVANGTATPSPDVAATATASGEPPLWQAVPIEDPTRHALDAFYAALQRAQNGEGQARIVFYGASHTASDMYTGPIRQQLQKRFGEAGAGFVVPGKPWKWYRHAGINTETARGFRAVRIKAASPVAGRYGLAGVAIDARIDKPASTVITTRPNGGLSGTAAWLDLYYLEQPNGGHLNVFVDGARSKRIDTRAHEARPAYVRIDFEDAQHRIELRSEGDGRVRIFGLALERDVSGVVLDTLGIPGTRVRDHLYWDDAIYREHLARRKADLIVLAYGTNESGDDDVLPSAYEALLRKVLVRLREVAPGASCVLVGPTDRPIRNDDGTYSPRPLTDGIIEVQRRVAPDYGCGFFDTARFMGGQLSMTRWVTASPPLGTADHVHFTQVGYQKLAEVLYGALMTGYPEPSAPVPTPVASRQRALPKNVAKASSSAL